MNRCPVSGKRRRGGGRSLAAALLLCVPLWIHSPVVAEPMLLRTTLIVADLEKSLAWYRFLGFEVTDSAGGPRNADSLTLHYRQLTSDRIEQALVARVPIGVYASPAYVARKGNPRTPSDLSTHRCIGYSQQVTVNDWNSSIWQFAPAGELVEQRVTLGLRSNSGLVLRRLAIDGHGIAILPRHRVTENTEQGELIELMPEFRPPPLSLYASFASAQRDTLKLRRLIEALQAGLARRYDNEQTASAPYEAMNPAAPAGRVVT